MDESYLNGSGLTISLIIVCSQFLFMGKPGAIAPKSGTGSRFSGLPASRPGVQTTTSLERGDLRPAIAHPQQVTGSINDHCRNIPNGGLFHQSLDQHGFTLDQCGSCHGLWFDTNEWEALRERNLHDEVNLIFSAPWQAQVRKNETRQFLESMYTERLKEDYAKVSQIKEWLDNHPEKELILGYLANPEPYSRGAPTA